MLIFCLFVSAIPEILNWLRANTNPGGSICQCGLVVRVGTYGSQLPIFGGVENSEIFYYNAEKECKKQNPSQGKLSGSVNSPVLNYAVSKCKSYIIQKEIYPF